MKRRSGFVSNSSSSSFIVVGQKPKNCLFVELDHVMRKFISRELDEDFGDKKVYLTEYLSDTGDVHYNYYDKNFAISYKEGNHGGPYQEEGLTCLLDEGYHGVWIDSDYVKCANSIEFIREEE